MTTEQSKMTDTQKEQAAEKLKQGADHVTEEQLDIQQKYFQDKAI